MFPRNSVFRQDPFFTTDSNFTTELDRIDNYMPGYWHPYDATPRSPMLPPYNPPINNERDKMVVFRNELDQVPLGRPHAHGDMFRNVEDIYTDAQRSSTKPSKVHSYRSSKISTYTSDGVHAPKKYVAFTETTQAPNGVQQTLKRERNSVTGKDRMQAGRYIDDRGHVVEKTEDLNSRDVKVNHDYFNMDQYESDKFNNEWEEKVPRTRLVFTRNDGLAEPRRLLKWQHPFSRNYDGSEFDDKRHVTFVERH